MPLCCDALFQGQVMTEPNSPSAAPQVGLRTHYLPQFILRRFRDESLYELDKQSMTCGRRNEATGGQATDLYPPHLERGLFLEMDNAAARICRDKIFRTEPISLVDDEKRILSEWLLLFAIRIPWN